MGDWLVVTGGSRGIGRAVASRFAAAGFGVLNLSRHPNPDAWVLNLPVDLGEPGWEEKAAPELARHLKGSGRVCVVHSAALYAHDDALDLDPQHFRRVLEVNLVAPASLNHLLKPYLRPGSSVIFIGSTLSEKAVRGNASYVTSNHAVVGLMRSTCQDLVGTKVHTACVCPGFTDTEMLQEHMGPGARAQIEARTTFGRLIEPSEIAEVVFSVASNPVLNGAVIHANLGQIET